MSPVFAHGQLRLYLLALLNEGPRHGYEVIQDLEQRFNGPYTPSAGRSPEACHARGGAALERSDEGRKAVYRIIPAGRAEVAARSHDLAVFASVLDPAVLEWPSRCALA